MIEKKSQKGDLDKKRNTFLLIGLVAILGLVYAGFELFATSDMSKDLGIPDEELILVMDEDVIATDPTPPPPPPPIAQQAEVILKIVEDNIKVNTDFDFSQDFDLDMAVEEYVPIDIVAEEVDNTPPMRFVEEMPEPVGGMENMYEFLRTNLRYPEVARNNNISGQVFLEFVVEKDGSISGVKVIVGVYPDLDQEAIRVVKMMPKWKPGKQMGKPVRCFFNIPVRFTIN
ncbi:MAG: energy transducer TonB [Bacteroidetes bacterium]|nr:energy transducer TonB [Bacteroidota bacterium]MCL1969183.1 energy transducer TonB [Bacteroidota bacterium]